MEGKNPRLELGVLDSSLTPVTYLLCDLGQATCSVWTAVCPPAKCWGPGISLSGPFLLVTLPASHLVQDVVPHPPRGLFASTPSIPEGTPLPFPAKPGPGSHWTPERTGVGETILAVQAARGVCWPVASHNRPRDTEGRLSGGPAVSFKPTLSPWPAACLFFPPSQAAVPAPSFVRKWDVDVART